MSLQTELLSFLKMQNSRGDNQIHNQTDVVCNDLGNDLGKADTRQNTS